MYKEYEISHCNQLIRDKDNNRVMTFRFFHEKFGFLPPSHLIVFKVPIMVNNPLEVEARGEE